MNHNLETVPACIARLGLVAAYAHSLWLLRSFQSAAPAVCSRSPGLMLGLGDPTGAAMKPLGDGFIKLIKMIIAPIIFCTVVVGIAGMEDMKKVGKTGGYALLYFEVVSTVALIIGLVIVNLVQPGVGINVDPATLDTKASPPYAAPGKMQSTVDFLLNVIPNTVVDAFAKGDMLQVLLFSVLFGFALHALRRRGNAGLRLHRQALSHVLFASSASS